ncbi:hypothetical protein CJO92_21745 (plasmid) [Ralstonia solanacearum]|uniref:Uncharacterized protein n=1 Tax=Ralstonia solanacearum TaxID=305 RepID=A0AAD0SD46_RALSL|nr:hypothetical protein CJO77_21735 [Ralstonia solanacearum]AXW55277.1 hypothetical protein CJO92_21745 [Ralstonia solanacearum]
MILFFMQITITPRCKKFIEHRLTKALAIVKYILRLPSKSLSPSIETYLVIVKEDSQNPVIKRLSKSSLHIGIAARFV